MFAYALEWRVARLAVHEFFVGAALGPDFSASVEHLVALTDLAFPPVPTWSIFCHKIRSDN